MPWKKFFCVLTVFILPFLAGCNDGNGNGEDADSGICSGDPCGSIAFAVPGSCRAVSDWDFDCLCTQTSSGVRFIWSRLNQVCLPYQDLCGNGVVDEDEECETTADCAGGFFCDDCECVPAVCGNGVIEDGEECESNADCDEDSLCEDCECVPLCGNGVIDPGEECETQEDCEEGLYCAGCKCLSVPPPGEDIVVFNDINPFDNTGMTNPNNVLMVTNLVDFVTSGPRGSATTVWFDRGRNSKCAGTGECSDGSLSTMRSTITGAGFTIENISSTSGSITSIPAEVKVIFLWNPLVPFTLQEVNAFKEFAKEGGRVVFIGEWDRYYGSGIELENDFLLDMGAVMTNIGMAVDPGYTLLPETSLRPHQITQGLTNLTIAYASVIVPGPQDYPLFYDTTNTFCLAGVAQVDTTPIPLMSMEPKTEGLSFAGGIHEGQCAAVSATQ